jgi:hypothetical protein
MSDEDPNRPDTANPSPRNSILAEISEAAGEPQQEVERKAGKFSVLSLCLKCLKLS